MKNSVSQFLGILADNDFKPKYRDIPRDSDNRDELLAELHEMESLPDSMRYYEVNGYSRSPELIEYLDNSFNQFRVDFLSGTGIKNHALVKEIDNQLGVIRKDLKQVRYEAMQIRDADLNALIAIKIRYVDELADFIRDSQISVGVSGKSEADFSDVRRREAKTNAKQRRSFKWLKENDKMLEFYHKMKSNGLIAANTQEHDFKAVFSNVPVSDIKKPVQWEQGAKLFAYFFNLLIENRYIPQRPSWILLPYCFTYYKGDIGSYIPIPHGNRANVDDLKKLGAPKHAELVDELFESGKEERSS